MNFRRKDTGIYIYGSSSRPFMGSTTRWFISNLRGIYVDATSASHITLRRGVNNAKYENHCSQICLDETFVILSSASQIFIFQAYWFRIERFAIHLGKTFHEQETLAESDSRKELGRRIKPHQRLLQDWLGGEPSWAGPESFSSYYSMNVTTNEAEKIRPLMSYFWLHNTTRSMVTLKTKRVGKKTIVTS